MKLCERTGSGGDLLCFLTKSFVKGTTRRKVKVGAGNFEITAT